MKAAADIAADRKFLRDTAEEAWDYFWVRGFVVFLLLFGLLGYGIYRSVVWFGGF